MSTDYASQGVRLVTVSGPPSAGKTSVLSHVLPPLAAREPLGVVKFDCLATDDDAVYEKLGLPVLKGLSGNLCPDHFFVSNIEDCLHWAARRELSMLVTESAGLCNRCAPFIKTVTAICVLDNLSGVNTPKKVGPMLKMADIVVITKGDIVSQAEREVFALRVRQASPRARILHVNGITGQGAAELATLVAEAPPVTSLEGKRLRFSMPAALCSYCLGETKIGRDAQIGNIKTMDIPE